MNNHERTKMIRRVAENLLYMKERHALDTNDDSVAYKEMVPMSVSGAIRLMTELERREPEWTKEGDAKKDAWKETEASYREVAADLRRRLGEALAEIQRLQKKRSTFPGYGNQFEVTCNDQK